MIDQMSISVCKRWSILSTLASILHSSYLQIPRLTTQSGLEKTYHSSLFTVTHEQILRIRLSSYEAIYPSMLAIISPGIIQECQTPSRRVLLKCMMQERSWVSAVQMHAAWLVILSYMLSKIGWEHTYRDWIYIVLRLLFSIDSQRRLMMLYSASDTQVVICPFRRSQSF